MGYMGRNSTSHYPLMVNSDCRRAWFCTPHPVVTKIYQLSKTFLQTEWLRSTEGRLVCFSPNNFRESITSHIFLTKFLFSPKLFYKKITLTGKQCKGYNVGFLLYPRVTALFYTSNFLLQSLKGWAPKLH